VANAQSFLHGHSVEVLVVVDFGDVFGFRLALEVHEGSVVLRQSLVVPDVSENVEEVLVVPLGVLNLVGRVVG